MRIHRVPAPTFPSRKDAAQFYGVTTMTIGRWLANGELDPNCIAGRRFQAWEVGEAIGYPIHHGPNWIAATEIDQIKRLGLDRWLRLATGAQTAIAAMTAEAAPCGTR